MKEKIEKEIKELEEDYDWNLQKSEDFNFIKSWPYFERRMIEIKIAINTYKEVLEMLENEKKGR